jgi:hypothetical protein
VCVYVCVYDLYTPAKFDVSKLLVSLVCLEDKV